MKQIIKKIIISFVLITMSILSFSCNGNTGVENIPAPVEPPKPTYNSLIIYVDGVIGSDSNDGLVSDSPLKTLSKAVSIAGNMQSVAQSNNKDAIEILLKTGTYESEETIKITSQTTKLPLIIKGEGTDKTVISGGNSFKGGWSIADSEKNIYKINVGNISFRQLYHDGIRSTRARYPNVDEGTIGITFKGTFADVNSRLMGFPSALICEPYFPANAVGVEVLFEQEWAMSVGIIEGAKDGGDGKTYFKINKSTSDPVWERPYPFIHNNTPAWFENAYEFIDIDNEWYYNKITGELFFKAPKGSDINSYNFTIPQKENIIVLQGNQDKRVKDIIFENLSFAYSNFTIPDSGYCEIQATNYFTVGMTRWEHPPAAVELRYAENIFFDECGFYNTGATAVDVKKGSNGITFNKCTVFNAGGTGISIGYFGEMQGQSDFDPYVNVSANTPDLINCTQNITIQNCYFTKIGLDLMGGSAICSGYSRGLKIQYNEIHDIRYSGVALGWGWQNPNGIMTDFQVKFNRIYDTVNGLGFDGSEIYVVGVHPKGIISEITGNYITPGGGLGGVYFDEGTNDFVMTDNVIDGVGQNPSRKVSVNFHDINYKLKDIIVKNTFTLSNGSYFIQSYTNNGAIETSPLSRNVSVEKFKVKSGNDWSKGASDIIKKAGLNISFSNIKELVK